MKTTIISQEKNPFLEREEFMIKVEAESTPTEAQIIEDLGKDANLTVVRGIRTNFGVQSFIADVVVYDSEEAKEKYVVLPQKVKKKMAEEKKAKEAEEKKKKAEEEAAAIEAEKAKAEQEDKANEESEETKDEAATE